MPTDPLAMLVTTLPAGLPLAAKLAPQNPKLVYGPGWDEASMVLQYSSAAIIIDMNGFVLL